MAIQHLTQMLQCLRLTDNQIFYDYTADDLNLKIRSVSIGSTSTSTSDIGATANNVLTIGNGVAASLL